MGQVSLVSMSGLRGEVRKQFWNKKGVLLVPNHKLPAVAYVDDRAVRFVDWEQSLNDIKGHSAKV